MPTPALIDIESLVQEIPGNDPSGGPISFNVTNQLDELRSDIDPERDFEPDDPRRKEVKRKEPMWDGIIELGQETLRSTSKSLLVAVRMTEALTMRGGFGGARDGFRLLRRLSEECWDRMQPPITEPDDNEVRAGMFNWLDDPIRGALYPNKLRTLTFLMAGSSAITVVSCRGQDGKPPELGSDAVVSAARAANLERCQNLLDDINETIEEIDLLTGILNEKMPEFAPSFYTVRKSLDECLTVAQWIRSERGGDEVSATQDVGATSSDTGSAPNIMSRDGAYEQLRHLAEMLERLEPHSPVPYLIRRAVELRTLKFPELVDELTKDSTVLAFMKREVGSSEAQQS